MFNTILIRPLINFLVVLYNTAAFRDLGIAVILFVLIIKVVLYPLSKKALMSQIKMQKLQPKLKELQVKHKDNKEEQSKAMMGFWKENKVNPFSGCLPMLIQLPIILAIFHIFKTGIPSVSEGVLYTFVKNPGVINQFSLGFINLSIKGGIILAVTTGLLQFFQMKLTMSSTMSKSQDNKGGMAGMTKPLMYMLPLISVYFVLKFSAALGIYWLTLTGLSIIEHLIITRAMKEE